MHRTGVRALGITGALFLVLAACSSDDGAAPAGPGNGGGAVDDGGTPGDETAPPDLGPGCGAAGVKPGVSSKSITVAGTKRTYTLFVPSTYDDHKSFPLILVFHGDGGTGANIRGAFQLEAAAAGGAVLAYPDGEGTTWQIDGADGVTKDIAFIDALAAELAKTHCTDPKRVFAVGFSKGAYFTNMLACITKSKLRAVVTHAGGGPFGLDGSGTSFDNNGNLTCPAPPVAALQVQGTADTSVPVSEGTKARDYWRATNTCKTTTTAYDPSPCVAYDGCAADRPEVWCQIPGMTHTIWQNGPAVTWAFLKTK
jgi:polyhydroxybutyrate depolymerase